MAGDHRLETAQVGDVTVVRLLQRRIVDEPDIQVLAKELLQIADDENCKKLLVNFTAVEFLSSAALGKLILLDKRVKARGAKLMFSNIRPDIYQVFVITKLHRLFEIKDDEADALAAFAVV